MERLNPWLESKESILNEDNFLLLKKAATILRENVCEGERFPWHPLRCIRPFGGRPQDCGSVGIWNWDTAFHTIGVLHWDAELAKEQILGFIQYQLENGMFPDVIRGSGQIEDVSSKPPILAWSAAEIYKKTKDSDFVKKVYSKFVKNEEFWRNERFYNGMFFYGADMTKAPFEKLDQYIRWESGWDDSVRWDSPCSDYWPIDLNCYAVMMYRGLTVMARALGNETEAEVYEAREKILTENINKYLWNDDVKAYTDTNRFTGTPSSIMTPASFTPLYIEIATKEKAESMSRFAANKNKLYPGMPTVSYDDPEYSQKYWRGNTWLNVAYFAAKGLKNYGYTEIAEGIRKTILEWVKNDGEYVHENYNSKTGEGLFCDKFSWSCVFVIEFILNF